MRRFERWCRLFLIVAAFFFLLPGQAQGKGADERTFVQLLKDWAEARKAADIAFLEKFYAKELTIGNMDGSEATRAQDLAMFSSGDLKPNVITDEQIKVYLLGQEAALVTGVEHLEGQYKGHSGQFDLRFANTFVYRDGRWQLLRHQATQIKR